MPVGLSLGMGIGLGASAGGSNPASPFLMTVNTASPDETFTIPCQDVGVFDALIDWGDGSTSSVTAYNDANLTHTYASADSYQISISGSFPNIYFAGGGDRAKVLSVDNLGSVGWETLQGSFRNCSNMVSFTSGVTDTSNVTSIGEMLRNCSSLTLLDILSMDTSNVDNMGGMLRGCPALTLINVSNLDTSNVDNMGFMIAGSTGLIDVPGVEGFNIEALDSTTALNSFMANVTLPTSRYDSLLVNWAAQDPFDGMTPSFGFSKYTAGGAAETARNKLINTDGWVISDGGAA